MSANIFGERFYGYRTPAWHKIGEVSQEPKTASEIVNAKGYWFEKRPLMVELNGEMGAWEDQYVIVRSKTVDDPYERPFGVTTKQYNIIQPLEIAEMFDECVGKPVDTWGALGQGERMFLTWELEQYDIAGSPVISHGTVICGYDGKMGASLLNLHTRIVCQNTWNQAIQEANTTREEGMGRIYSGKHNSPNVKRDLGIWMSYVQQQAEQSLEFSKGLFALMAKTPVSDQVAKTIVGQLYPDPEPIPAFYPDQLRVEHQLRVDDKLQKAERERAGVMAMWEGAGTEITHDAWGLFQSITEYENWGRPTKKPADSSICFGNRASQMTRAFGAISGYVKTQN